MKIATVLSSAALLTVASLGLSSQAEAASFHVRAAPVRVQVNVAPAKVWVPGHWTINVAGKRVWVSGDWRIPPRAGAVWVPGHYVGHGPHRRWVSGHWS